MGAPYGVVGCHANRAAKCQLSVTGTDHTLGCPRVTWIWLFRCFFESTARRSRPRHIIRKSLQLLEGGRSVRGYPTPVSDPLSSFGHAVWRFLKVAPAGRYAALDLSDRIGAYSCPCAFYWLQYFLGQPWLSENFSRGA